jgi:hypothetical protein
MSTGCRLILAAIVLLGAAARPLPSQSMDVVFTEEELFEVYRRMLPEPDARELARASAMRAPDEIEGPVRSGESELSYRSVAHSHLTFDTLVLLSLLSDEMNAKVERYLVSQREGHQMTGAERAHWERRRAELREWANAGYSTSD